MISNGEKRKDKYKGCEAKSKVNDGIILQLKKLSALSRGITSKN